MRKLEAGSITFCYEPVTMVLECKIFQFKLNLKSFKGSYYSFIKNKIITKILEIDGLPVSQWRMCGIFSANLL
tara:strand:- start:580 stop:798 length:219 start_codon:yes stop_codon:yes gene_type:complete